MVTPAALWGDWLANGPVLIFFIIALDVKSNLSRMDWIFITSFFFCLLSGFSIILSPSYTLALVFLVIAMILFLPVLYLPIYSMSSSNVYSVLDTEDRLSMLGVNLMRDSRFKLSVMLVLLFPLYPLTYALAWSGRIEPAVSVAVFIFLSLLVKGLFAAAILTTHYDVLMATRTAFAAMEEGIASANETRRTFLKYLFHEIRNPLNSLSIGIEVLGTSTLLSESEAESLLMMKEASNMIANTLNDVLSLQKIEEG